MHRIFFDANSGDPEDGYFLIFELSRRDLEGMGSNLKEGVVVTLYDPEEIEVDAELKFDSESNLWRGVPVSQFRDL